MIYWKYYDSYRIIRDENLNEMAKEHSIELVPTELDSEVNEWFNFAHIVAIQNDFNIVYETCFEYYVTLYFADEGISAGAEEEYFMKKLDVEIANLHSNTKHLQSEKERKILFFNKLVEFFKSDKIKQYEKRIFLHNIRVDKTVKEWFLQFDTVRDGILQLLNNEIEKPKLNIYTKNETYVSFTLTYSEESRWRELSPFSDKDRLRVLTF